MPRGPRSYALAGKTTNTTSKVWHQGAEGTLFLHATRASEKIVGFSAKFEAQNVFSLIYSFQNL